MAVWSDEDARSLADRFLALFPDDARFFTHGVWSGERMSGWYVSVAGSTFEAGVVAVSPARAGILWVGDED